MGGRCCGPSSYDDYVNELVELGKPDEDGMTTCEKGYSEEKGAQLKDEFGKATPEEREKLLASIKLRYTQALEAMKEADAENEGFDVQRMDSTKI
jgi:hypothetical protein